MRPFVLATLCLLPAACAQPLPPSSGISTPDDRYAMHCLVEAWRQRQAPATSLPALHGDADAFVDSIRIIDATTPDEFVELCRACPPIEQAPECKDPPFRAYGCSTVYGRGAGPLGIFYPWDRIIVVSPGLPESTRPRLFVHEMAHHIAALTERAVSIDPMHTDVRVWGVDGVVELGVKLYRQRH